MLFKIVERGFARLVAVAVLSLALVVMATAEKDFGDIAARLGKGKQLIGKNLKLCVVFCQPLFIQGTPPAIDCGIGKGAQRAIHAESAKCHQGGYGQGAEVVGLHESSFDAGGR